MPNWKKLVVSGSDAALNSLFITNTLSVSGSARLGDSSDPVYINNYRMPLTDGTAKQIMITDGIGNVTFDFNRTLYEEVKNVSGGTLPKGTPVHVVSTTGNTNNVIAASASLASSMPATFILDQALNNDEEGLGIILGHIQGVDTSAFSEGDIVYVGENGGYTNMKPTGSNLIQPLGIVIKVDASNGSGLVMNPGVTNDTPNLLNGQIFWGQGNTTIQKPLADLLSGSAFDYSGSFTGSLFGTSSWANSVVSSSYALTASYALNANSLLRLSGSTIYPFNFGVSNFSTDNSILIGSGSGNNTPDSSNSMMIGNEAGYQAETASYSIYMGKSAGKNSTVTDAGYSPMIGIGNYALEGATGRYSLYIGDYAGNYNQNIAFSTFVGNETFTQVNINGSEGFGYAAGITAENWSYTTAIGNNAGGQTTNIKDTVFLGSDAGSNSNFLTSSVFIGKRAGIGTEEITSIIAIGKDAANTAWRSLYSIFIGDSAGSQAYYATSSIMIGRYVGYDSVSSSYSTYIGDWVGKGHQNGENNIIIGTGITLPNNYNNGINLGGLIFGSGSINNKIPNPGGAAVSASANGKIGINQPNPLYSFDVSGSGNYTNGLTVTGSLTISGSSTLTNIGPAIFSGSLNVTQGITGSLFGTASYANYALTASYALNGGGGGEGLLRLSGSTIYPFDFGTENFSTEYSVLIGSGSGNNASNSPNSIFIGKEAGSGSYDSSNSIFIGNQVGIGARESFDGVLIGDQAGAYANNSNSSTFIGAGAGNSASGSNNSTFLGAYAGRGSVDSYNSIMIGRDAGESQNSGGSAKQFSILIGDEVAVGSGMSEAIAIGRNASSWLGFDSEISLELGLDNLIPEASRSFVDHTGFNSSVIMGNYAGYGSGFSGSYYDGELEQNVEFSNGGQIFIGQTAGAAAYNSPNSTFIGNGAGVLASNNNAGINLALGIGSFGGPVFIGSSAGVLASNSSNSTFIGPGAGSVASNSPNSTFIGAAAGTNDANYQYSRPDSILIGAVAGANAGTNYTIAIGQYAGFVTQTDYENLLDELIPSEYQANFTNTSYTQSILIGTRAGYNAGLQGQYTVGEDTYYYGLSEGTEGGQIFIGNRTGERAYNTMNSVFIGEFAGSGSHESGFSTFIGPYAGRFANNSPNSTFIGSSAGVLASNSSNSTFIGYGAGYGANNSNGSTFIGQQAGISAYSSSNSVMIGNSAGFSRKDVNQSVFLGYGAGTFDSSTPTLPGINNAVFIGPLSGFETHTSDGAVFIGNETGVLANYSEYSTFIGNNAGNVAYSSSHGIFIGSQAGAGADNSPFSIYLGNWNSMGGYGTNNIAIGNGIGLPYTSSNQMNIAGLIFGSGSYSEYAEGAPFTGSANGRIGINQPNPQASFDVSGSVRISRLSTSLTAPSTSGTTKMVITDSNGDLSFANNSKPVEYTFGGTGVPTVSATIPYLYIHQNVTCSAASLIVRTPPDGDFTVVLKKSTDSGVTFPTTITTITLSSGSRAVTTSPTTTLSAGDFISAEITAVNNASNWTLQLLTNT